MERVRQLQGLKYYASGTGGHLFQTYDGYVVNALQILNNGNVGIGTTNPQYTLDVAGQVHATSFVAYSGNNYADFVFKPGYKLPPLSDVEASIKRDGHLPGIPSEDEAKAHGIDLASMQVKLLQKIEELTLHVINQEKRLDEQNSRVRAAGKRKCRASRKNDQMNKSPSKNFCCNTAFILDLSSIALAEEDVGCSLPPSSRRPACSASRPKHRDLREQHRQCRHWHNDAIDTFGNWRVRNEIPPLASSGGSFSIQRTDNEPGMFAGLNAAGNFSGFKPSGRTMRE